MRARIGQFVGHGDLVTTARTYTHVLGDEQRARLLRTSHISLIYGPKVVNRYHGSATISQGAAIVEGDCIIESVGGPAPGSNPAWAGRLQDPGPTMDLVEGGAWLRLADGRECEIQVERAVAGSGLTEFSGAKGIRDLH